MSKHKTPAKSIEAEEAEWLKERRPRSNKNTNTPDVGMASLGTDQEAGGAISAPLGRRKYS
ncbi:MAG: hypothetical protein DI626_07980 [Micavibrio aeruginosavorus]|uniref:Uncharacterized protein n=1 Tax=Micavibrio aeruginosavorus TaxID=349221 RepID=A0A2W4ZVI5_9BACT|nr:MAG: hypothetical protein DI626_07980 [Micavibrio aeruginosavorus]